MIFHILTFWYYATPARSYSAFMIRLYILNDDLTRPDICHSNRTGARHTHSRTAFERLSTEEKYEPIYLVCQWRVCCVCEWVYFDVNCTCDYDWYICPPNIWCGKVEMIEMVGRVVKRRNQSEWFHRRMRSHFAARCSQFGCRARAREREKMSDEWGGDDECRFVVADNNATIQANTKTWNNNSVNGYKSVTRVIYQSQFIFYDKS